MAKDKNSDFEKVSLSKVVRETSKVVENSPTFKELFDSGREMWKLIPKKQYIRILMLSFMKGVFDGLVAPKVKGK